MDINIFLRKYNTEVIKIEIKNTVAVKKYD